MFGEIINTFHWFYTRKRKVLIRLRGGGSSGLSLPACDMRAFFLATCIKTDHHMYFKGVDTLPGEIVVACFLESVYFKSDLATVFSEKTDAPPTWIFSFSTAVTLKIRPRSPQSNQFFCYVPIINPWKIGKSRTTGSQDIMQTKKCHADTNGIRTKINMSSSP